MQKEPVVVIFPDGSIVPGVGCTIGELLAALDGARQTLLSIVLRQSEKAAPPEQESTV